MLFDDASDVSFAFEAMLPKEKTTKKRREICQNFQEGKCHLGDDCPERHIKTDKMVKTMQLEVCRHWLIGRCVNGENCLFAHEYDERRVPECLFLARYGECTNPECTFKHANPADRQARCAAYERGFCPMGPHCKLRHVKRDACPFFMTGFCPLGPQCKLGHPVQRRYDRIALFVRREEQLRKERRAEGQQFNANVICYKCFDPGHVPTNCPGVHSDSMFQLLQTIQEPGQESAFGPGGRLKGCFLCGEDHRAKECPEWQALHPAQFDRMRRGPPMGGGGGAPGGGGQQDGPPRW